MKLTLNRKTTEDFEEYVKLNKDTIQLNALNNTLSFYLYENSDFDISDSFKYIMEFDFQNNDNIQDIIEDYDFETEDKNEVRYINPSQLKEFIYNDEEFDEMDKIKLSTDSITKEEFFEKLGIRN